MDHQYPTSGIAHAPSHGYRMRWENVAIIGLVLVAVVLGAVFLLGVVTPSHGTGGATQAHAAMQVSAAEQAAMQAQATPQAAATLTASSAAGIVDRARTAMLAGDFAGATNLLAPIDGPLSDSSGANTLRDEIATRQMRVQALGHEVTTLVDQGQWRDAHAKATELRAIAPPSPEVAAADTRAVRELRAAAVHSRATALYEQGDYTGALALATSGFASYHTPALGQLVSQLQGASAAANAAAGGATTAASTATASGAAGAGTAASSMPGATAVTAHPATGSTASTSTASGSGHAATTGGASTSSTMPGMDMSHMTPQQLSAMMKRHPHQAAALAQQFIAGGGGIGSGMLGGLGDASSSDTSGLGM